MAQHYGALPIVGDGLALALDCLDINSYPGSGSTSWNDISGNKLSGSLSSGTIGTTTPGVMTFTGTAADSYCTVQNPHDGLARPSGDPLTCEVWAKDLGDTGYYFGKSRGASPAWGEFDFGINSGRKVNMWWSDGNWGGARSVTDNVVTANNWFHVCITKQANANSPDGCNIYVNGVSYDVECYTESGPYCGTNTILKGVPDTYPDAHLMIGKGDITNQTGVGINAQIPVVRIYWRELSKPEVLQNFNAQRGRFGV